MTDRAEEAFEAARAEIARVKAAGEWVIDLGPEGTLGELATHLDRLPSEIGDLAELRGVRLNGTLVRNLFPLAGLVNLELLSITDSVVDDVGPLEFLASLKHLHLSGTRVADLSPLSSLVNLENLYLSRTGVADLGPLSLLGNLKILCAWKTKVSDLQPLAGLSRLEHLLIAGLPISDISPLTGLSRLCELQIVETNVSDLSPLSDLINLTSLQLDFSPVADLTPLTHLYALAEGGEDEGVSFGHTPAAASDPRLAEIAEIPHGGERSKALLAYLAEQETLRLEEALEAALRGPILAESLADLERRGAVFEAVSLERAAEVPPDLRHDELLGALQFAAARLARAEVQNRMGRQVADTFLDYAEQSRITPLNPRILNLLGKDIRAVLADEDLSAGLDGFDVSALRGFLVEHDAFLADYYPRALLGLRHEVTTDPATLRRELFPRIKAAEAVIAEAEILAPSVGKALELVERHAEAANRRLMTAHDPERLAAAQKELNRGAVLAAGFVGRTVVRLRQFAQSEGGRWKADPLGGLSRAKTIYDVAGIAAHHLTPIFRALWSLVTKAPPPF